MSEDQDIDVVEQENVPDTSLGARLRQARELKNLSLVDAAWHLHLGVEKIEALEQGKAEQIAAPVFVTGYLRAYARLLNLPADEIVSLFEKSLGSIETQSAGANSSATTDTYARSQYGLSDKASPTANSSQKSIMPLALLAIVLVIVGFFIWGNSDVTNIEEITEVPAVTIMDEPVLKEEAGSNDMAIDEQIASSEAVSTETVAEVLDVEKDNVEPEVVDALSVDAELESDNEGLSLQLESQSELQSELQSGPQSELAIYFSEDSWIEVNDAQNQQLMYRLGQEGVVHTVMGVAPFDLRLGYVPGVNIIYNGEPYDLSRFVGRRHAHFQVGNPGDQMTND